MHVVSASSPKTEVRALASVDPDDGGLVAHGDPRHAGCPPSAQDDVALGLLCWVGQRMPRDYYRLPAKFTRIVTVIMIVMGYTANNLLLHVETQS